MERVFRDRLQRSLLMAMKAHDEMAVSALRSALSAISNAEAVQPGPHKVRLGIGSGDVPRRELSEADMRAIIQSEIDERRKAAAEYDRLGQTGMAERLRSEAGVLSKLVE